MLAVSFPARPLQFVAESARRRPGTARSHDNPVWQARRPRLLAAPCDAISASNHTRACIATRLLRVTANALTILTRPLPEQHNETQFESAPISFAGRSCRSRHRRIVGVRTP